MRNDWVMERAYRLSSTGANPFGGLNRATTAQEAISRDGVPGEARMSWRIEVVVDDSGEWEGDPLRFETQREALAYARDLEFRWSAVRDKRVVKSEDPVNHSWPQCGLRARLSKNAGD
jgi:hypothetical protein